MRFQQARVVSKHTWPCVALGETAPKIEHDYQQARTVSKYSWPCVALGEMACSSVALRATAKNTSNTWRSVATLSTAHAPLTSEHWHLYAWLHTAMYRSGSQPEMSNFCCHVQAGSPDGNRPTV